MKSHSPALSPLGEGGLTPRLRLGSGWGVVALAGEPPVAPSPDQEFVGHHGDDAFGVEQFESLQRTHNGLEALGIHRREGR